MPPTAPFDVEIHEMELCNVLKAQEDGKGKKNLSELAMDEAHPEEEEEEDVEEKETREQDGTLELPAAEEQRVTEKQEKSHMTH